MIFSNHRSFLDAASGAAWKRLGVSRRAGVLAPLFSIRSKKSAGVGEFPDLELLADWCRECGMSLIQLLPLNDVGTRFCPYDAESSFALDPMHLALEPLAAPGGGPAVEIKKLRARYRSDKPYFDTRIKRDKLALLRRVFAERRKQGSEEFARFKDSQVY